MNGVRLGEVGGGVKERRLTAQSYPVQLDRPRSNITEPANQ